ncbi:inhibitor of nuclear factor kappa-B kinase subunit beta-like [Huso huso]|uniref:Inhibitor of nuclear factor kappa-B kinase subunit beta-like n=1 Tax=Huso huso TaxID=61971 RepID=A0ABR0Y9K2_HUSHU
MTGGGESLSAALLSPWLTPLPLPCSKTVVCRQKVMELQPQVEGLLQQMSVSERMVRSLQERRQKELWNLLKVACSKVRSPLSGSPEGGAPSQLVSPGRSLSRTLPDETRCSDDSLLVIEESKTFESRLQSLVQETLEEQERDSKVLQQWDWLYEEGELSRLESHESL